MKKLILLLTIITLSFSCSSDSNSSNNNNNNSFTNSMDYEFTITINGEVHKVKGNTTNGIPYGTTTSYGYIGNMCYSTNPIVYLNINDVTASNYISGQNIGCQINILNLVMGTNQATVSFGGGYLQTLANSLGSSLGFSSFITNPGEINLNQLPLTITDLGTASISTTIPYNFGQTLKGNYSGTIYLSRQTNTGLHWDIPVQLSIDFKALRQY